MRYAVSHVRDKSKVSGASDVNGMHSPPATKATFSVIKWIVILFFCIQFLVLAILYLYYDFFQESSLSDFKNSFIFSKTWESSPSLPFSFQEKREGEQSSKKLNDLSIETITRNPKAITPYKVYPANINSVNALEHLHPASKELVQRILGTVVEVDFPDLFYRPSSLVREQLTTMFQELPKLGFHDDYHNPCWYRIKQNPGEEGEKKLDDDNDKANQKLACLPYAYILGQPKAGTSDLYERLKAHPSIR